MSFANDMLDIALNESTGGLMNVVQTDEEIIQEFKSDIKAAYAARRYAEKQSGQHDAKKTDIVPNKKGEGYKGYYHSTTPGKDAKEHAKAKNNASQVDFDEKNRVKGEHFRTDSDTMKYDHNKSGVRTAAQKKELDKWNKGQETRHNAKIKKQDFDRKVNKVKSALGRKVDKSSSTKNAEYNIAKEAVEEWYAENGIVFNEYEAGCVDMFVSELLSE